MDNDFKSKFLNNRIWILLFTVVIAYIVGIYLERIPLNSISEGDIGRDLYNFYLVSKGQLPFIDFKWIYGPLVPFIYGYMFKFCGVSMLNALSLFFLVHVVVAFIVYILVKNFSNSFYAFLAGILFITYHSLTIQTFNHVFGTMFLLFSLLFLKYFLDTEKKRYLYLIAISCFLLATVKLNMGLAISGPILFFLFLFKYLDKKPVKHIIYSTLIFSGLTILIYGIFISLSPDNLISKCFPYSTNYLQGPMTDPINSLLGADNSTLTFDPNKDVLYEVLFFILTLNLWYYLIALTGFVSTFFIYKKEKFSVNFIFVFILSTIALLSTHEFFMIGTFYSLRFWTLPIVVPLAFYLGNYWVNLLNAKKYFKPIFISCCLLFFVGFSIKFYFTIKLQEYQAFYCLYDRVKVKFLVLPWLTLLTQTTDYIEKNTSPDDKVLSLPYNMISNFVSKRDAPSVFTEFLWISNLTTSDEIQVINDLVDNKVKLILYANRMGTIKSGVGVFGQTHCQLLDKYIKENYELDVTLYYYDRRLNFLFPVSFYKRKTPFKPASKEYLYNLMKKDTQDQLTFL